MAALLNSKGVGIYSSEIFFLKIFFFMCTIFKVFTECITILLLLFCLFWFPFLTTRHVGSQLVGVQYLGL